MTEEEENKSRRKKSVIRYAKKVFQESSVSAVSGIAATESLPRKAFKFLIFIILTSAFLYQVIKFLTYLFEYPTVVNIDISKPDTYMAPAFTLCHSQLIRRSKYCAKYPDRCIPTDAEFCEEYTDYCKISKVRVKKEFYWKAIKHEDILHMGYGLEDILQSINPPEKLDLFSNKNLLRPRNFIDSEEDSYFLCQTYNSIVDKPEEPIMAQKLNFFDRDLQKRALRFNFDPHEEDVFDPDIRPGIYFSVHSPYEAVNPSLNGHFMQPGRKYKISVSLKEEELLPYPYKTDCMDYIGMWLKNNRTGPRTEKMCKQKCVVDFISECLNCTALQFEYPSDKEEICTEDHWNKEVSEECRHDHQHKIESCVKACKEECLKKIFVSDIRETYLPKHMELSNNTKQDPSPIYVDVDVNDEEILRYVFSPKYLEVEAFSYIGGFIGIWLGISLVQVVEFVESVFLISRYLFKRCRNTSNTQNV